MDLRRIRYFVGVASAGGFSAAAERLHIAQPALTRQIKLLEEEFGTRLFKRTPHGAQLTEIGRLLYDHATIALRELEIAADRIEVAKLNPRGRVILAVTPSVGMLLIDPLKAFAKTRHSGLSLEIVESMGGDVTRWLDWIKEGRLDLAILFDVASDPALAIFALGLEDLHLVGRAKVFERFLGASTATISLSALNGLPLVLPHVSPLRTMVERKSADFGFQLRVIEEADSLLALNAMIRDLDAFSIQTPDALAFERRLPDVVVSKIVQPVITRTVNLVYSATQEPSFRTRATMSIIVDTAKALVRAGDWQLRLSAEAQVP